MALVGRETDGLEARGMDIDESVADRAHQMVVGSAGVGVVASGAVANPQLEHLPHLDQLPKRVVDGGEGHLGEDGASPFENVVGREVHVIAGEDLSDGAPLGRDPPATGTEAFEEGRCGSHAAKPRGLATRIPIFVRLLTQCISEIRTLPVQATPVEEHEEHAMGHRVCDSCSGRPPRTEDRRV